MRREIPQKVDAQVGFAAPSPSGSAVRFGAALFRRTRSASALSITLTATALGIFIPQTQATAYFTTDPNRLDSTSPLPQLETLEQHFIASRIIPKPPENAGLEAERLIIPLQPSIWETQELSPSAASHFSTTPNTLSALEVPLSGATQPEGLTVPLNTSVASVIQLPALMQADLAANASPSSTEATASDNFKKSSALVHTVERGENLTEIADRYEVSPESIAHTNRIQNPNVIDVNEDLVIPSATLSSAMTPLVLGVIAQKSRTISQSAAQLGVAAALLEPQARPSTALSSRPLAKQAAIAAPSSSSQVSQAKQSPFQSYEALALATTSVQSPSQSSPALDTLIAKRSVFPKFPPTLDLPPLESAEEFLPAMKNSLQRYIWPAKGVFTSGYGPRWGRMHRGIDIAAPVGTPIVAAAAGVVVTAGWNDGGYGNLVEIRHQDGSLTVYAHNSRILTRRGALVNQGELIAAMGSTGRSTGPHSHFEIHPGGRGAVDPMFFLSRN